MSEWQPIETAPKDGKQVLLWCLPDYQRDPPGAIVGEWREGGALDGWDVSNVGGWEWECDLDYRNPTHWMPLPEPPK